MSEPIHAAAIRGIVLIADGLKDIDVTDPDVAAALLSLRIHPVMKILMIGAVRYEVKATLYKNGERIHEMITDKNALLSDEYLYCIGYVGEGERIPRKDLIEVDGGHWHYIEPTAYPEESRWEFDIRAIYPCGTATE